MHVEPTVRDVPGGGRDEQDKAVHEIARLVSREVRETDLLSMTRTGRLSLVLLDADMPNAMTNDTPARSTTPETLVVCFTLDGT